MKKFDKLYPFFAADDGTGSGAGAEVTEPAEPSGSDESAELGVEETEPAEPSEDEESLEEGEDEPSGKNDADAAFAEMRRENERLKAERDQYEQALGLFFEGDGDEKIIEARATATGQSKEDIRKAYNAESELSELTAQRDELQEQVINYEVEKRMASDLKDIQAIDPSVKSLDDLGEDFLDYIATNQLSAVQAYYAVKAKDAAQKATPPKQMGKINPAPESKDFYSKAEVENMSQAEVKNNYEAIRKSMQKW